MSSAKEKAARVNLDHVRLFARMQIQRMINAQEAAARAGRRLDDPLYDYLSGVMDTGQALLDLLDGRRTL